MDTRVGRAAVVFVMALAVVGAAIPAGVADSGSPPAFVRTIGGPGHADMYPSGAEIDPSSGAYVVADTGNNRIEKYTAAGSLLWNVGGFGTTTSPLRFNNPRDVGIDASGDVFVADTGNVRIVKLDGATGAFMTSWKGVAPDKIASPIGISVSLFTDLVYVADAGAKRVRVYDTNGNHIRSFGDDGTCVLSNFRDVDAGPNGVVYIANYLKNNIVKMSATGACLSTWGTKGTGNGQFKNPYGVRVVTDPEAGTAVFVADSNNNRVQEFSVNGDFLAKFGSTGTATNQFGGLRRVAVGPPFACAQGQCMRVAGADLWGWKLGVWTGNGVDGYSFTATVPSPVAPPPGDGGTTLTNPDAVFNEARQLAVAADGSLRVMDSVNQRVVWFNADGSLPTSAGSWRTCGKRGWTAGAFNWPRGIAIDQATGNLWVADTKQSRLQVIKPDCTSPVFLAKTGSGLANLNWPYQIAIDQGTRTAFVADSKNNRIVAWDVASRSPIVAYGSRGSSAGQFNLPSGISVAPGGHLFVADKNNNRIVELGFNGSNFSWIGTFTGSGTPKLKKPEGVAADGTYLYVADTMNNRMAVIRRSDNITVGTVTGMLTPQSVTVSDGCVYVSDTYHDVVKVYSYGGCA
jgi:sugar lactone lactonase YvrE